SGVELRDIDHLLGGRRCRLGVFSTAPSGPDYRHRGQQDGPRSLGATRTCQVHHRIPTSAERPRSCYFTCARRIGTSFCSSKGWPDDVQFRKALTVAGSSTTITVAVTSVM